MVVQGKFALQLIDAETQQPLNEYCGPSGSVHYAVAKENGEYFLRFQVLDNADDSNNEGSTAATGQLQEANNNVKNHKENNTSEMMYFRPSVDGKDLGFYTNLTAEQGARDVGLWTYINGIGTNQALKFETTSAIHGAPLDATTTSVAAVNGSRSSINSTKDLKDTAGADPASMKSAESPPKLYMGNVQVQISKAVFTGQQKRVYTSLPPLTNDETVVADPAASTVSISASSSLHEDDAVVTSDSNHENASGTVDPVSASASASSSKTTEEDSKSTGTSSQQPSSASHQEQHQPVPVLRSREGSQRFQEKVTEECPTYKPGDLLETITIHYGSTAALIQAGVLVPVGGLIPQFVGVSAGTTTMATSAADDDGTKDATLATVVATNTAPLATASLPATNSTLESVTAPPALTKSLVANPLLAGEGIEKVTTMKQATVVDKHSADNSNKLKGDSGTMSTVKRSIEKDASPPAKKVCRESTNTRKATVTTGRVTRATAAVSSS